MKAIELRVDGHVQAIASLSKGTIVATVACYPLDEEDYDLRLRLSGCDGESSYEWFDLNELPVGTVIQLSLVDASSVDPPRRSTSRIDDSPKQVRARYENAKKAYFALRDHRKTE